MQWVAAGIILAVLVGLGLLPHLLLRRERERGTHAQKKTATPNLEAPSDGQHRGGRA